MTVEEAITAAGTIVPSMMDAIGRLFPGISMGSEDRAKSRSVNRALRDMEIVREAGEANGMSQESIDALCSAIAKERIGCERLTNVIRFAAEMEPITSNVDDISTSWAEAFREHAEGAVEEEAQRTWAAVLAGEMEAPGSFSKRTMSILSDMDKASAEAFELLCSVSIGGAAGDEFVPLIPLVYGFGDEGSWTPLVDSDSLADLGCLGLVHYYPYMTLTSRAGMRFSTGNRYQLVLNGQRYIITNDRGTDILCMEVALTTEGSQLSTICKAGCAAGFEDLVLSSLRELGCSVFPDGNEQQSRD